MGIAFWFLIGASLLTVELFLRAGVPGQFLNLMRIMVRAQRVLVRRRASDIWKERAITALWLQMMRHTALHALTIVGVFLPMLLLYLANCEWRLGAFDLFQNWLAHIALIVGLIFYAVTRGRLGKV